MSRITYLLGAGASCGIRIKDKNSTNERNTSLPLVFEIPDRIEIVIDFLNSAKMTIKNENIPLSKIAMSYNSNYGWIFKRVKTGIELNYFKSIDELIYFFERLKIEVENHASIDTFAKKLYLKKNNSKSDLKYERAKQLIDLFFLIEHFLYEFDLRYDLFFATTLNDYGEQNIDLPERVNFINWNYDISIEYSISNFIDIDNLFEIREYLESSITEIDMVEDISSPDEFKLIALNGRVGGFYFEGKFYSDYLDFESFLNLRISDKIIYDKNEEVLKLNDKKIDEILKNKIDLFLNYLLQKNFLYTEKIISSPIKFAWEIENQFFDLDKSVNILFNRLSSSDILVIIGYSFPTFNRNIDKVILESFFNSSNSKALDGTSKYISDKKIFLQVPESDYKGIKSKIESLIGNEQLRRGNLELIYPIESLKEFYIPFEYN
jgi:hypothetical protein